ncbi:hypothetical protein KDA_51170 [Dictyobacter alpinus]|uniref:DUF2306 domain-containing protein n=2 Tax=Dictyobacter alpinus TaxID=2014873 RepID=A0A402BE17_9CHLR|nr:hypothetical protein KDA_51170 [Dictyobacter alpinus]
MVKVRQYVGWSLGLLVILGIGMVMISPYVQLNPAQSRIRLESSFSLHYALLTTHIFLAFIALVIGPLQFIPGVRRRFLFVHQNIGRVYLSCVLISGIAGFIVGLYTRDFTSQIAFLTLAVLWLISATMAYRAIRRRRIAEHFTWMVRNYAFTLVAVVARIIVPLSILVQLLRGHLSRPLNISQILDTTLGTGIWLALVLNLLVAEWLILQRVQRTAKRGVI